MIRKKLEKFVPWYSKIITELFYPLIYISNIIFGDGSSTTYSWRILLSSITVKYRYLSTIDKINTVLIFNYRKLSISIQTKQIKMDRSDK